MPTTSVEAAMGVLLGAALFVPAVRAVLLASIISLAIVVVALENLDGLVDNVKMIVAAVFPHHYFTGGTALGCLIGFVIHSRGRSK
jgi:hypothetical protein